MNASDLYLVYRRAEDAFDEHRESCTGYCSECERLNLEAQVACTFYLNARDEEELINNA